MATANVASTELEALEFVYDVQGNVSGLRAKLDHQIEVVGQGTSPIASTPDIWPQLSQTKKDAIISLRNQILNAYG